ncbi:MAG: hypothetical protein ACKVTZ_06505, partial [Bacteroidia bacterium]
VREVCRVGKTLYEGINDAKYSNYVVYQTKPSSNVTTHSLAANTETPVLSTGIDENVNIQLENTGNTDLVIYVHNQLETGATGYLLTIHTSTILKTNNLSAGGYGMLIARNANPIEGKLKVKLMEVVE